MATLLDGREWDYVVGSVHFLRRLRRRLRRPRLDIWRRESSPERVWKRYFETLARGGASGLYDIIAHPDLVKVWGARPPAPDGDPRRYYEPAVEAMLEPASPWRSPPPGCASRSARSTRRAAFLEMAVDAGLPDRAVERRPPARRSSATATSRRSSCSTDCGVREICVFEGRERRLEPLG